MQKIKSLAGPLRDFADFLVNLSAALSGVAQGISSVSDALRHAANALDNLPESNSAGSS